MVPKPTEKEGRAIDNWLDADRKAKKPWAVCGACHKNEARPQGSIFGFVCEDCYLHIVTKSLRPKVTVGSSERPAIVEYEVAKDES
jgi:hypothetical protein